MADNYFLNVNSKIASHRKCPVFKTSIVTTRIRDHLQKLPQIKLQYVGE